MTVQTLIDKCAALGIVLSVENGGIVVDGPRGALTPELVADLRKHKNAVLAQLRSASSGTDMLDVAAVWHAALDQLEGDRGFPPQVVQGLRAAEVHIEPEGTIAGVVIDAEPLGLGPDGWPEGSVDINELDPCPKCGSLDQWQTMAGDPTGMTVGGWRCRNCDPPVVSDILRERAEDLRRRLAHGRSGRTESPETSSDRNR